MLLTVPPWAGEVTAMVIGCAAPTSRLAAGQVTVPPTSPQVQPEPVAETKVRPAGSTSVTLTEVAVLGPAFETARTYEKPALAFTGSTESDFTIDRSAWAVTSVVSPSLLFA